ncbi:MAG TPA: DDE-type integrase/transposase/recombinase [Thermoplasmata archaeon]
MSDEPRTISKEQLAYQVAERKGKCKYCASNHVTKYGRKRGVQVLRCKDCHHTFEDNGRLPKMRTPTRVIASALRLYVDGLSHKRTGRNLYPRRDKSTIWRWLRKYAPLVREYTSSFRADLSTTWHADETAIKVAGVDMWTWFTEDAGTRFIASSSVTEWGRKDEHAVRLFREAKAVSLTRPERIVTDRLAAYREGVRRNFYANTTGRLHLNRIHFRSGPNNNLIERLNGTFKDRVKTMRGFQTPAGAEAFSHAFVVQYDFLRGHESLDGGTPAIAAGIRLPFDDGWGDLIRWATYWKERRGLT